LRPGSRAATSTAEQKTIPPNCFRKEELMNQTTTFGVFESHNSILAL
jgi:hypothetical protein